MAGQIIVIAGTSGAGKTTTCSAYADRARDPHLTFGFDLLVGALLPARYTMFGEERNAGYAPTAYGPVCMKAIAAMHEMIAAAVRFGQSVVVDHITFVDPPVLQDCVWRLIDLPVLFVGLRPPRDVLVDRVRQRRVGYVPPAIGRAMERAGPDAIRQLGEELAGAADWFYDHAYAEDLYDLTLDSSQASTGEICDRIDSRLAEGPGTAFSRLRSRYADPR